jgi:branched-chain amino acid aminotransferase/para-aminobenzoate synthetase component 1
LQANGLTGTTAAIKILLTRGTIPDLGLPSTAAPTLVIYARPYAPPSPEDFAAGWPLATFPERRSTFLGRHKSLNYLFYLAARQYALDQGAKEALILESDGLVSEGSATTLVYTLNGRYFTPAAASALPSVTLTVLSRYLAQDGHELEAVPTPPDHLRQTQGLWLLNSLIGLMPVSSWDGNSLPLDPKATLYLQDCLNKAGQQDLAARCNLEL